MRFYEIISTASIATVDPTEILAMKCSRILAGKYDSFELEIHLTSGTLLVHFDDESCMKTAYEDLKAWKLPEEEKNK